MLFSQHIDTRAYAKQTVTWKHYLLSDELFKQLLLNTTFNGLFDYSVLELRNFKKKERLMTALCMVKIIQFSWTSCHSMEMHYKIFYQGCCTLDFVLKLGSSGISQLHFEYLSSSASLWAISLVPHPILCRVNHVFEQQINFFKIIFKLINNNLILCTSW